MHLEMHIELKLTTLFVAFSRTPRLALASTNGHTLAILQSGFKSTDSLIESLSKDVSRVYWA